MKRIGKVWLAGAGPGDAGLLTVKTKRLMEEVDVIVYDALISAEILSQIPEDKELIHVGKRSGYHLVPQEGINRILLEAAQEGKQVLRLKGGDPFVFGRGGEELELLREHHIPFEIVPGVTSVVAVPAYAGIPITHRDHTSSFHVITGHPRKDGSSRVDYKALAAMKGTLVFLMGISSIQQIVTGLLQAGMKQDTAAAILEKGSLAAQRRVVATLSTLVQEAEKAQIQTPAIIMVGQVCALANTFHWAEDRALGGKQILITRPKQNISKLAEELKKKGAQVIELPCIVTKPVSPNPQMETAFQVFGTRTEEEWLVFTSPIGVQTFFEQMSSFNIDMRTLFAGPAVIKIAAIGTATAAELKKFGIHADLVPEVYCAGKLGESLSKAAKPGSFVTIVRAKQGSVELIPPLEKAGLQTEDIALYETQYKTHSHIKEKISTLFQNGEIDAVTFTSVSTVKGFVHAMEWADYSAITAICIGEQTAAEAKQHGMKVCISKEATIHSLVEMIEQVLA